MESVAEGKLTDGSRILTVNTGSSSIKVTLYRVEGASEVPELSVVAERIGVRGHRDAFPTLRRDALVDRS
jgi:acetate kinase